MSAPAFLLDRRPLPTPLQTPLQTKAACTHHWLVASLPVAGLYPAHCRRCGAQRAFPCLDPAVENDDFRGAFDDPEGRPRLPLPPNHADGAVD